MKDYKPKPVCEPCPKRSICVDPDVCPRVGPQLRRLEHGDQRYKKNRERPALVTEAQMDRIDYLIFKNAIYGAYDGD